MKKIVQFIIVLSSMLLIVGCAAQKKMLPQEIIEVKMQEEMDAKNSMFQELLAGGADTTIAPYQVLATHIHAMHRIVNHKQTRQNASQEVLLQEFEDYLVISEKVTVFMHEHNISQLDIRATEEQIYAFLHQTALNINGLEQSIRDIRQQMYDEGQSDASAMGQTLSNFDNLNKAMIIKTGNMKKIIDSINGRAQGMKTVWIGPGTALNGAMDDITVLTHELNSLSAQANALQKKLKKAE